MQKYVPPTRVRPGDIADHRSGILDPRPVEAVDREGERIRLRLPSGHVTAFLPLRAYTFTRNTPDPDAAA